MRPSEDSRGKPYYPRETTSNKGTQALLGVTVPWTPAQGMLMAEAKSSLI